MEKTNPFRKAERGNSKLYYCLLLLLHSCIAVAAVYGSVAVGLEGNLSFFTAVSACGGEEFSCGLCSVLSCIAAGFASLGLVLEAFFCIEFLFTGCENEFVTAIFAL